MKLLNYRTEFGLELGIKTELGILDVAKAAFELDIAAPENIKMVLDNIKASPKALQELVNKAVAGKQMDLFMDEASIEFGPSVPAPGKIICVGLNYRKHAEESNMPIPEYPILFNKFNNSIASHGEAIQLPVQAKQIDYEAELAIVIGKKAKEINREEAAAHIFGYTVANDLSSRDLQFRTNQWLLGKSLDDFSPIGPYLVTADEIEDPQQLSIKSYVNGELRQNSNTSDMIFDSFDIVSYISQYMTLEPGDIILTGTPEGVIMGYPEDKREWLQPGDEVTIEIEKLGKLTNKMK